MAMTLGVLGSTPAMAATTGAKAKPLSLSNVTVASGPNAVEGSTFFAISEGIFAKFGLNVTFLNVNSGAAAVVATLIGGSAQFATTGATSEIAAANAGGPLRALLIPSVGGPQQLAVTQSFAAAHNIPSKGTTVNQAIAQVKALKGTHAVIANSSVTSNSYAWLLVALRRYGLTYGAGCSTCDINLTFTGTVPNEVAALKASKVDGIGNVPPTTTQPNTVVIQYGKVPPLNTTIANYDTTTITMIQQHPDTVQAFVDALVYAQDIWRPAHKAKAEADIEAVLVANGSAMSDAIYATKIQEQYFKNPFPTRAEYNNTINSYNVSTVPPITLPYSTFVVTRFAANSLKKFHLKLP